MNVMNFGSFNIDHVYRVEKFVKSGETLAPLSYHCFYGGKGFNQTVALCRAGVHPIHAGCIGKDGVPLKNFLEKEGADVSNVRVVDCEKTGHAVIQVASSGENSIIIFEGANGGVDMEYINNAFTSMQEGDILLLQNETASVPEIIQCASGKKMRIFFNAAPFNAKVCNYPLNKVDTIILNETEAQGLSGSAGDFKTQAEVIHKKYPGINLLFTLGKYGSAYISSVGKTISCDAVKVDRIIDTTAAGDTYIGFFTAGLLFGWEISRCMEYASEASALCIARNGASASIPYGNNTGEVRYG